MGLKEYQERKRAEQDKEQARQKEISSGKLEPIKTEYNLDKNEKAYATFFAKRMGKVNETVTHKQSVVSRSSCGCCLLGPLGALLGGVTAPSRSHEIQRDGTLDSGTIVFTNKRFLFIGKGSLKSLPYTDLMDVEFNKTMTGSNLRAKYHGMAEGEYYTLSGEDSRIAELWYKGVKKIKNKK